MYQWHMMMFMEAISGSLDHVDNNIWKVDKSSLASGGGSDW